MVVTSSFHDNTSIAGKAPDIGDKRSESLMSVWDIEWLVHYFPCRTQDRE